MFLEVGVGNEDVRIRLSYCCLTKHYLMVTHGENIVGIVGDIRNEQCKHKRYS